MWRDVLYCVRVFRRSAGFALVAISAIGTDVSAVAAVLGEVLLPQRVLKVGLMLDRPG